MGRFFYISDCYVQLTFIKWKGNRLYLLMVPFNNSFLPLLPPRRYHFAVPNVWLKMVRYFASRTGQ